MRHKQFLLAGLFGLGFLSLLRPSAPSVRGQMLDIRQNLTEALDQSNVNLRNQFTPGYKTRSPWGGLSWTQGEIFKTQTPTNLAINGSGCFGLRSQGVIAYTRDGRFSFQDGELRNNEGWSVLGMPVGGGEAGPIRLELNPSTKLYADRYTGFHFDETGKLFGECTLTDPVTGRSTTTSTSLFQLVLFQFPNSSGLADQSGAAANIWVATEGSGRAVSGVPGQGALGAICAGSLELSNVDFNSEGTTLMWLGQHRRAFAASHAPPEFQSDERLRQAALDNLAHQLSPGYRSWDLLGYLKTGQLKLRMTPGQMLKTNNAFDLALQGDACLVLDSGEVARNGHLIWNERGLQCGQPGGPLLLGYADEELVPVRIPAEASNLEITPEGEVRWIDLAGDGQAETHYQLALARAEHLTPSGPHLRPAGKIAYGVAGAAMGTRIVQGSLETSNGDLYEESLEAAALLELAGLPPFFVDDLRKPDPGQRPLTQLTF